MTDYRLPEAYFSEVGICPQGQECCFDIRARVTFFIQFSKDIIVGACTTEFRFFFGGGGGQLGEGGKGIFNGKYH